jgi:hypothetical protein
VNPTDPTQQVAQTLQDECPHDSLSGNEGPVRELGRMPVRWRCDACGAIVRPCSCCGTKDDRHPRWCHIEFGLPEDSDG